MVANTGEGWREPTKAATLQGLQPKMGKQKEHPSYCTGSKIKKSQGGREAMMIAMHGTGF